MPFSSTRKSSSGKGRRERPFQLAPNVHHGGLDFVHAGVDGHQLGGRVAAPATHCLILSTCFTCVARSERRSTRAATGVTYGSIRENDHCDVQLAKGR